MNGKHRSSSLRYEHLETRNLLAGDVTVVENGHLFIRGDELSNQIEIVADESGQVTINGLRNTTINGSTDPFQVTNVVDLQGQRGRNAAFDRGLRIRTFGGNDRIDIRGIELGDASRIVTGEGHDFVRFIRSTSRHDFLVTTEQGEDSLRFTQARLHEDFVVNTGAGEDAIGIHNSRTRGDTNVNSGSGDDHLALNKVRFTGENQHFRAQEGDDQIRISKNDVNESGLSVFAGIGRDHVFAEMSQSDQLNGDIFLAGQEGFDVLDIDADEGMEDLLEHHGFVSGSQVDGFSFANDRADSTPTPSFNYVATAVEFEETTRVNSIDWLGSYYISEAPESDNFVIEIYESESIVSTAGNYWYRQPVSEPSATFEIGDQVNRIDSGEVWFDTTDHRAPEDVGYMRNVFSYSAEIEYEFSAGKNYWVSIYAITDAIEPGNASSDSDFAILLDYPGEAPREYVQPTGNQAEPYANNNASLSDFNTTIGIDPSRWSFSWPNFRALMNLNS